VPRRVTSSLILAACLASLAGVPAHAAEGVRAYISDPGLKPPALIVNTSAKGQSPGYIFVSSFQNKFIGTALVGQGGPEILDNTGHLVWLGPATPGPDTLNFQTQSLQGKPVLTWWSGTVTNTGEMAGNWYVANDHYNVIATLKPANGWFPSGHELFITSRGTALVTAYRHMPADLSSVNGPENGDLIDSGVLEYDIKTGQLLKEWSAAAHIPLTDSYVQTSPQSPVAYDPWHINSIDVDGDGNWLVSMRNSWSIHKVGGATGDIIWTLGGKSSTFTFGENAAFAFQHNARFRSNGEISMFDNECCALIPQQGGPPKPAPPVNGQSRGLVLKLDETAHTASFVFDRKLYDLVSGTQGNMQLLPNGHAFIGWGQQPFFSEHDENGKLLLSIRFPDPDISYRAYRYVWRGRPTTKPKVVARRSGSRTRLWVSWNGATDVAAWRVLAGRSSRKLAVVTRRVSRKTFETAVTVRSNGPRFIVQALDAQGRVIGASKVVRRTSGNTQGTQPQGGYAPTS
jgi:hypothetical protein